MVIITFFFNILCKIHILSNVATFMLSFFYNKSTMFEREKTQYQISLGKHVTWQKHSAIAKYKILKCLKGQKNLKLPPFSKCAETATAFECVTEMLIFRSSRSQTFFKISILKNFAILEPLFNNKVADLLLQNTYGGCFWMFVAVYTFS